MRGRFHARCGGAEHANYFPGIGSGGEDAFLRTAQLCCGNKLHGAGDLLRAFHRANAPPIIEKCRHRVGLVGLGRRRWSGLHGCFEALFECVQRFLRFGAVGVVERFLFAQRFQQAAVIRLDEGIQLLFETATLADRKIVEILIGSRENDQHLIFDVERLGLILFQNFHQALAARELRLRGFVELLGAELREGREIAILREIQAQSASDLPHGFDLRVAADAADGNTGVHGRADAAIEKVGLQENLTVGDGNYVRRNVGGNIAGLCFDYGQRGQRTRAQFVVQFRSAFQQARVQEENVSGKRFAARRAAQQQRNFAVGLRVLGKIVVEADGVALGVAEIFADGAGGEWRDVLHRSGFRGGGSYDDAVLHRAVIGERLDELRDGGTFLANGAVNANHVAAALVQDCVNDDGGFSDLTVANDQLALAAADGNHSVNGLDAGLDRFAHGLAIDHAGSETFERIALRRLNGAFVINGIPERVHNAADHAIADRHGHDFSGAFDGVAFFDFGVITQEHRADLIFFQVQRDAENVVRKLDHFAGHALIEAVNARDAVAHGDDRADFLDREGLLIIFDLLAQYFGYFIRFDVGHPDSCVLVTAL